MTDEAYTPHPDLVGPWRATLAAVQALVAQGVMPNVGAVAVFNMEEDTMLLQAFVNPMRVDEDRDLMDLAVAASKGEIDWTQHPVLAPPAQSTKNGIKAVFAGKGTSSYEAVIAQLLASLAYASLNDAHWAERLGS